MKWIPNSLIDYPGKTAAVLFLPGCNLRCPYCHNPELALAESVFGSYLDPVAIANFMKFLESRKGFLDGVVISGGEPTIHTYRIKGGSRAGQVDWDCFGIHDICQSVKNMGYPIKLDTNGTYPDVLKHLIEKNLVDYVALSLKSNLTGIQARDVWCKTLPLLSESGITFEIRIVAVPDKTEQAFETYLRNTVEVLRDEHKGIEQLKLHCFNKGQGILNPAFYEGVRMFSESDYQRLAEIVRDNGLDCEVV